MLKGIDVSRYQPNTDWAQVKASGIDFAFIKASEGAYWTNPWFKHDMDNAKAQGIARGPYHFFRPSVDATSQMHHFLSTFKQEPGDLRCMFDWELSDGVGAEGQKASAKQCLDIIKAETGMDAFLYSYESYLHGLGDLSAFALNPLYIAKYSSQHPIVPRAWHTWTIWQTSGSGHIGGVHNLVDVDLFNGDLSVLEKFKAT